MDTSAELVPDDFVRAEHEGYEPGRTTISTDSEIKWLKEPISGELTDVPGLGPKAKEILVSLPLVDSKEMSIQNTFQLMGKFLSFRGNDVSSVELCDRFWHFLKAHNINAGRNSIVKAIAEKCGMMFPGSYAWHEPDWYSKMSKSSK